MKYYLFSFELQLDNSKQVHLNLFSEKNRIKYVEELESKTGEKFEISSTVHRGLKFSF